MKRKSMFAVVCLAIICLVFGGCGGKSQQPSDSKTIEGTVEETLDIESGNISDEKIEVETKIPEEVVIDEGISDEDFIPIEERDPIFTELDKKYKDIKPEDLPEIEYVEITPEEAFEIKESEVYDISGELIKLWEVKDDVAVQGHWFEGIFEYEEGFYFDWSTMYMGEPYKSYIGRVNMENGIREYAFDSKRIIVSPVKVIAEYLFMPEYKKKRYPLVKPLKFYIGSILHSEQRYKYNAESKRYEVTNSKNLEEFYHMGGDCSNKQIIKYDRNNNSLLVYANSNYCFEGSDRGGLFLIDLNSFKTVASRGFDYPVYEIIGYKLDNKIISIYRTKFTDKHWELFSKSFYDFGDYEKLVITPWFYDDYWIYMGLNGRLTVFDKNFNHHLDLGAPGYRGKWLVKGENIVLFINSQDSHKNCSIKSFNLKTGELNWEFVSIKIKDIALQDDSILALVLNKESGGFDFLEIDYETGISEVTYKDAFFNNPKGQFFWGYYDNKGFEVFDNKIIVDGRICYAEKSKYPGVIIPDQAVVFSVVDVPSTQDEWGWETYELSGYLEEDTFTILNNTDKTKTFEISNIDERLEVSVVSFTLEPDAIKEIVVRQTVLEHGKSPNIQITDMKDLIISWDDGEKILPVRFPEAPYTQGIDKKGGDI